MRKPRKVAEQASVSSCPGERPCGGQTGQTQGPYPVVFRSSSTTCPSSSRINVPGRPIRVCCEHIFCQSSVSFHMDKITSQAISDFHHGMVSKGLAKGTANRGLVLLKYMFNLALKWDTPGCHREPCMQV